MSHQFSQHLPPHGSPSLRICASVDSVKDSAEADGGLYLSPLCEQLMALMPHIVWFADRAGEVCHFNEAWQRYTGRTAILEDRLPLAELFHAEDQVRIQTNWQAALLLQQPFQERARLQLLSGVYEWFLVTAWPQSPQQSGALDGVGWLGLMQRLSSTLADPSLMQGQEFLEAVFENISEGLVACNSQGQLVLFNQAAQALHGLPPEPIAATDWAQHYDLYDGTGQNTLAPEDVPLFRALNGDRVRDAEMMIILKNGQERSLIANADPIYDATGQQLGAVVLMRDVTDYRQATAALEASERRFHAIFNQTFQFIGLLAPDGALLEANQTALTFANLTLENVVNRPFWEIHWWQSSTAAQEQLRAAIHRAAAGEFIRYEVEVLGAGDSVATIDFSLKPVFDAAGQVVLIIPEGRDITASKQMEAELRALTVELEARVAERTRDLEASLEQLRQSKQEIEDREALLRTTFEQAAMGCAHLDLDGRWVRMNSKLCEIVGYSREELEQTTFQNITHPDDLAVDLAYVKQLLAGEIDNYALEKRYIRKDGTVTWVQITVSLRRHMVDLDGPRGKPLHFIAMVEDIGDRKNLEFQNEENLQALEQAKADLEHRNYELDQFVHIASHDLKAPLRAIANLSEWLEDDLGGQLPPDNQEQLVLMRQRVKRMERLIDGLLRYSRIGREQINAELVDTDYLLREIIDSLAVPPGFPIQVAPSMPTLTTKRLLLEQVFTNLLSNALKHHDRAIGEIDVGWHDQGTHYVFFVADDGPGIPPNQQEKVFGVFQTLGSNPSPDNTGIGLALIKKIVETEGGTIHFLSPGDRGCRFEFTWPKRE